MPATSSAIQLGDPALTWLEQLGNADLSLIDSDLSSDLGMQTAIILSLWLDRRAQDDDVPPSGDPTDRRGWWADVFATISGDLIGSRLWLLDRSVNTNETALQSEEHVREALQWMLDDRVVASIDVPITTIANGLLIGITVYRPDGTAVSIQFAHVWNSP